LPEDVGSSFKKARSKIQAKSGRRTRGGGAEEPARWPWRGRCCDLGRSMDKSHKAMDRVS
jgi:hypothetical protein